MQKAENRYHTRRFGLFVAVVLLASVGLIAFSGWLAATQRSAEFDTSFRRQLLRNVTDLASFLAYAPIGQLTFTSADLDNPAYREISQSMKAFGAILPNRGIYSMILRDGQLLFGPENYAADDPMASAPGTVYLKPPPEAFAIFEHKRPVVFGPYSDEYGSFISALAPVIDSRTGELLMVVAFEVLTEHWHEKKVLAGRGAIRASLFIILLLLVSTLLVFVKQRLPSPWTDRLKHMELILTLFFILSVIAVLSLWIHDTEQRERRRIFDGLAELHATVLSETLERLTIKIETLSTFFLGSEHVDEDEFTLMSRPLLRRGLMEGVGWIPGHPDDEHLPTQYISARGASTEWLQLDHARHPTLLHAIRTAAESTRNWGLVSMPHPYHPSQQPLLFVYRQTHAQLGSKDDIFMQQGFVFALIDLSYLLEESFASLRYEIPFVQVRLQDAQPALPGSFVHVDFPKDPLTNFCPTTNRATYRVPVAGFERVFHFMACPTPAFLETHSVRGGIMTGFVGVLFTLLMALTFASARQRQQTQFLEASERKFRRLFDSMTTGFALHQIILDAEGKPIDYRFLEINHAYEKQTGLKADDFIGRTLYETLPDTEPFWLARFAPVAMEGRSIHFEHYAMVQQRYFEIVAYSPEPGQFAVLVTDITPRKRIEEQLSRQQALQDILIVLATRFINIPTDQTAEATANALAEVGGFTRADRAYQFMYDFENGEATYMYEWCAEGIAPQISRHKSIAISTQEDWTQAHLRGEAVYVPDVSALTENPELRHLLEDQDVQTLITVPMLAGKRCLGFIGFDACRAHRSWSEQEINLLKVLAQLLTNAHIRKEAEQEQRELELQIQQTQKLESLGLLAGGIAHDFNNILTAIMGNAELAREDSDPGSPISENLKDIEYSARKAAELCRQMLAYAGKGRFMVNVFSINTIIEEMAHLLQSSVSKLTHLHLNLESELPPMKGDQTQIQQILLNLVINASEALENREGHIHVTTSTVQLDIEDLAASLSDIQLSPGRYVKLEVTDNGIGMDEQTVKKIFDPFFTTKFTGRGLGLSAVMGIVRSHEGDMRVQSEPGKGTVFSLYFPASTDAETAIEGEETTTPNESPTWKSEGCILLIEDEPALRILGERTLKRLGFKVLLAEDGVEGLEVYRAHADHVRAILLDLTMPRKGGEETLHDLQAMNVDVPVIIVSGYSTAEIATRKAVEGAAGFIQKPFTLTTLRDTLKQVLNET